MTIALKFLHPVDIIVQRRSLVFVLIAADSSDTIDHRAQREKAFSFEDPFSSTFVCMNAFQVI